MKEPKLTYAPFQLLTKDPFGTAHGTRYHTDIILVAIHDQGCIGYGEGSMPPYYDEKQHMMVDFMKKVDIQRLLSFSTMESAHEYIDSIASGHTASKAAIDIALHDLRAKQQEKGLSDYLGIPEIVSHTSMTIGIEPIELMLEKVERYIHFPSLKIKLNGHNDIEVIQAIRAISNQEILVDANQAWDNSKQALEIAKELSKCGVGLIEQPFKKGAYELNNQLRNNIDIPIIADEDCQRLTDVIHLSKYYDGINIKLMKCTGIYEAIQMIEKARSLGLKIMLGCMTESSIGISAASHLAGLVDWCDLDGNLLISNDLASGTVGSTGMLKMTKKLGIGIEALEELKKFLN